MGAQATMVAIMVTHGLALTPTAGHSSHGAWAYIIVGVIVLAIIATIVMRLRK